MLTLSQGTSHIAVNPIHVITVTPRGGGSLLHVRDNKQIAVDEDFTSVTRQLRGALLTRELHS
jgi:hypothetical protein